ncbi:unnamed protein product, partial [Rotaria sordida]
MNCVKSFDVQHGFMVIFVSGWNWIDIGGIVFYLAALFARSCGGEGAFAAS